MLRLRCAPLSMTAAVTRRSCHAERKRSIPYHFYCRVLIARPNHWPLLLHSPEQLAPGLVEQTNQPLADRLVAEDADPLGPSNATLHVRQ